MRATALADRFMERMRPHFGLLALATTLLCAGSLAAYFVAHQPHRLPRGERQGPATVACAALFYAASAVWLAQRLIPWSAVAGAASFTAVVALHAENATQLTHVAHLTNVILIVLALWYVFCARELRAARDGGRFLASRTCPWWVHLLGVWAVGIFYGSSGLTKLLTSGPGWVNGASLQLWASLWGDPDSVWTRLVLADRRFAAVLQAAALAAECAALPAVFLPRLRPWVGLGLIGFHVGQIGMFGWGFHANVVLVALFFLPCAAWLDRSAGAVRFPTARIRRPAQAVAPPSATNTCPVTNDASSDARYSAR
jgi:hypothetical protein